MNRVSQHEPEHLSLLQQLKGSYATVNMTLLSIIQGVALADLAVVAGANYTQFTLVHWLLVLTMLGLIVTIWNLIMMDAISLIWIPDFGDAALAFGIGAFELLLNHLIPLSLSLWLFCLASASCLEVVGAVFVHRRAKQEAENSRVLRLLSRRQRPGILHGTAGIVLFLLLGLLSVIAGFGSINRGDSMDRLLAVGAALLALVWVASFIFYSIAYWHTVLAYARTGRMPDN